MSNARVPLLAVTGAFILSLLAPASARPAERAKPGAKAAATIPALGVDDSWGYARLRTTATSPILEDDRGERLDGSWDVRSRLLAGALWQLRENVRFELELEALSGHLFGPATDVGTALDDRPFPVARDGRDDLVRVIPRKAFVSWTGRLGRLTTGAQTFSWGTGMLANGGDHEPDFGDAWSGNTAMRVSVATRPLSRLGLPPLWRETAVFVAADWIIRDDNASLYDRDRAYAGVVGVRAAHEDDAVGVLLTARHQLDRVDTLRPDGSRAETTVYVVDAHGRLSWVLSEGQRLATEGEAAFVAGETTRPWMEATWRDGSAVRQFGALVRVTWEHEPRRLSFRLESGYASGDNDPRDDVARTFTMHTDHNVGLLLFDHVLPLLSARAVDRLSDPSLLGQAPPGTRFAINPGAVQNAVYIHPVARWRPSPPAEVRLGYVFAVPAADVADAYQTGVNGGFATSYGGQPRERGAYGHEVDMRFTWDFGVGSKGVLRAGAEGGVLIPGPAFDGVSTLRPRTVDGTDTTVVWLARGMASLRW